MAPRTESHQPTVSSPRHPAEDCKNSSLWAKIKLFMKRAVFWSYERGSWQYDVIVLLILAFIFLTPTSWFHDRPRLQLSDLRHVQGILEVSHRGKTSVYQLDARLVDSLEKVPPRKAFHQLLLQRVKPPFVVKSVQPIEGKDHVILGYTVVVGH